MRLSSTTLCPALMLGSLLAACSDDPRVPQGGLYSQEVLGQPGVVLIDDMEDQSQYILSDDGLNGLWYVYNDESGGATQAPEVGFPMTRNNGATAPVRNCGATSQAPFFEAEEACEYFAHTEGSGFDAWGAGIGVDLNGDGGQKNPIDATSYAGIGFFARGNLGAGNTLRVKVQDASNTPESAVAADTMGIPRCDPNDDGQNACSNSFGAPVPVTDEWQWFEFTWDEMSQESYPSFTDTSFTALEGLAPPGFRVDAIVGIQFQVPVGASAGFDFSIDNLAFLEPTLVDNP